MQGGTVKAADREMVMSDRCAHVLCGTPTRKELLNGAEYDPPGGDEWPPKLIVPTKTEQDTKRAAAAESVLAAMFKKRRLSFSPVKVMPLTVCCGDINRPYHSEYHVYPWFMFTISMMFRWTIANISLMV